MKRLVLLFPLLVIVVGCGSGQPRISVLERYDQMGNRLRAVTMASSSLASEEGTMSRKMSAADGGATRHAAALVRAHGVALATRAGECAASVRSLLHSERNSIRRHYFALVLRALRYQWLEGTRIATLADLAWRDPLVLQSKDVSALHRASADVEWYAWMSVEMARSGAAWRFHHRHWFSYTPIHQYMRVAAGPYL